MKATCTIAISSFLMLNILGDEIKGEIMIGEWDKSFHAELHDVGTECYLIAIYDAIEGKNRLRLPQLDLKATIVGVIRGTKKIGAKIAFDRVSDGGFGKTSDYDGQIYYVFYHKAPMDGSPIQGQFYIDSQDPLSMFLYSEKRAKLASQHPHEKHTEQAGPDQPTIKSADKVPARVQPPTRTPKVGPQ